jgi:hypothetical protein
MDGQWKYRGDEMVLKGKEDQTHRLLLEKGGKTKGRHRNRICTLFTSTALSQ